jgi:guanine deaminase
MAIAEPGFTLIRGALLADATLRRATPADVLVQDGIIREVGPGLSAPEGSRVEEAAGMLIHPGLINAHTHAQGGLSKSQGDRWTLELLLASSVFTNTGRVFEERRLSALICAAEMVSKGCTAAYDLCVELPVPTRDGTDAVASAYAELGMRAVVTPMVADLTFYQAIPGLMEALPEDLRRSLGAEHTAPTDRILEAIEDVLRNWRWDSQDIRAGVAPTIPLHCTDDFMCGCANLARKHGVRLHSHVGESRVQAVAGMRRYGRTLVQHMDGLDLVGPDFTAAHAIWLDDDDLRIMADRGATVAHNAGSNMRLGNGMFPLRRMLDFGVTVGIGTDGSSCSDNQNMYEAMRAASMVSRVQTPNSHAWASSAEVYTAATTGSAKALGIPGIGAIAPGMKADIVFLDLGAINWIPHNATITQVVHAEDGTSVRHVMIGGRFVLRDRQLLTVDLADLARKAETARERLEALNADNRKLFERVEPVVASFCPGLAAQPYHLRRYLCDVPA